LQLGGHFLSLNWSAISTAEVARRRNARWETRRQDTAHRWLRDLVAAELGRFGDG
jgi:hypothetical protein